MSTIIRICGHRGERDCASRGSLAAGGTICPRDLPEVVIERVVLLDDDDNMLNGAVSHHREWERIGSAPARSWVRGRDREDAGGGKITGQNRGLQLSAADIQRIPGQAVESHRRTVHKIGSVDQQNEASAVDRLVSWIKRRE